MARLDYRKAIDPTVELFQDRDDYLRKTGKEAPAWDRNRPLANFRIRPDALAAMSPGKKTIVLTRTIQVHDNGVKKRDAQGRVEIGESEPLLRAWLAEPNFVPRAAEVSYGPYGSVQLEPPLIEFTAQQGLFVGGGSFGEAAWFEDGTADGTAPAAGGYTQADRMVLLRIAAKVGA